MNELKDQPTQSPEAANEHLFYLMTRAGKLIEKRSVQRQNGRKNIKDIFLPTQLDFDYVFQLSLDDPQSIRIASESKSRRDDGRPPYFNTIAFENLPMAIRGKEVKGNVVLNRKPDGSIVVLPGIFQEFGIDNSQVVQAIESAIAMLENKAALDRKPSVLEKASAFLKRSVKKS